MDGLNTLQIDNKLVLPSFLGAYPFDELPKARQNDFSVIVNTEPSTEPGDHWLPIIFKNGVFYFVDSFGRSPRSPLFTQEFKRTINEYIKGYKYKYNPNMIQSLFSNTCGYYSIYFIRELQDKSLREALDIFNDNFKSNDKLVVDYVNQ